MPFSRRTTFLFDLDGTLVDSLPAICISFEYILKKHFPSSGYQPEMLLKHVGRPLEALMLELAEGDAEQALALVEDYRQHNRLLIPSLPLFPGCLEMLQFLRGNGFVTGIVTSKNRVSTMMTIEANALADQFDLILTKDDCEEHKPSPGPLLQAMAVLKATPAETVYVGDAIFDIQSAKAAGCLDVGAMWGALEPAVLQAEEPTVILSSLTELVTIISAR